MAWAPARSASACSGSARRWGSRAGGHAALLETLDASGFDGLHGAVGARDEIGQADDDRFELGDAVSQRGDLVEGPHEGVPLERRRPSRTSPEWPDGAASPSSHSLQRWKTRTSARNFSLAAPLAVALADGDENLHEQGSVQVVHERDERLGGGAQVGGLFADGQLAAGDVQIAALAQQLAELRGKLGEFEWGRHGRHYRGVTRRGRKLRLGRRRGPVRAGESAETPCSWRRGGGMVHDGTGKLE